VYCFTVGELELYVFDVYVLNKFLLVRLNDIYIVNLKWFKIFTESVIIMDVDI
jgi:hypothetical protein